MDAHRIALRVAARFQNAGGQLDAFHSDVMKPLMSLRNLGSTVIDLAAGGANPQLVTSLTSSFTDKWGPALADMIADATALRNQIQNSTRGV